MDSDKDVDNTKEMFITLSIEDDSQNGHSNLPTNNYITNSKSYPSSVYQNPYQTAPQVVQHDPQAQFLIEFADGMEIKNLIDYLKNTNSSGSFRFSQDRVLYRQHSSDGVILNDLEIDVSEVFLYNFHSSTGEMVLHLDLDEFKNRINSLEKKESLRITKFPDQPYLFFHRISEGLQRDAFTHLLPGQVNNIIQYDIHQYNRSENNPNCKAVAIDFAKACKAISKYGKQGVIIRGYPNGITFQVGTPGGGGGIYPFGIVPANAESYSVPTPDKIAEIVVTASIFKNFSKIEKIAASETIKLFIEPDSPLKISCRIGIYAYFNVYIRDPQKN